MNKQFHLCDHIPVVGKIAVSVDTRIGPRYSQYQGKENRGSIGDLRVAQAMLRAYRNSEVDITDWYLAECETVRRDVRESRKRARYWTTHRRGISRDRSPV